jgi:hypothetical protein
MMMLLQSFLIYVNFVAIVFGWDHVSKSRFQSIIHENDMALVACESPHGVLSFDHNYCP